MSIFKNTTAKHMLFFVSFILLCVLCVIGITYMADRHNASIVYEKRCGKVVEKYPTTMQRFLIIFEDSVGKRHTYHTFSEEEFASTRAYEEVCVTKSKEAWDEQEAIRK